MADRLYDTEERQERIILVGVETAEGDDTRQSLEELEELGQTAGAVTVGMVIQKRERMHPGTYIGKGKIEEVAQLVRSRQADTVVCDDELSPAQLRNPFGCTGCQGDRPHGHELRYLCKAGDYQ